MSEQINLLDQAFKQLAKALKELKQSLDKANKLFSFVDDLPACDGCGSPTIYKKLNSPITGIEIFICESCWKEFNEV